MRDVAGDVDQWLAAGQPVVLATVIQTWGSAPRQTGANMALTAGGGMAGSVSGGCVEGAVVEAGLEVLTSGRPQLLHFGVADETAWNVGLACGGKIEVFVERLDPAAYAGLHKLMDEERPGAVVTLIQGPERLLGAKLIVDEEGARLWGGLGEEFDGPAVEMARQAMSEGRPRRHPLPAAEPIEAFIGVIQPSLTLVMVGGVHIAIALTNLARTLGYRTVIIDPRRAFGSQARFPHADQLIQAWPDKAFGQLRLNRETAVVMLTHDPKIDDPALKLALNSRAFYVGALGSQRTHTQRLHRLARAGLGEAQLASIHAPIGLDIGAQTPEEIALAIMAEIVAVKRKM
ncbi:MAG: XdhC/CoxI family protein [Chloroflexota bacterium]